MTAFLHLLALKGGHPAEVTDESPEKGLPAVEVSRHTDSRSHAERLGTFLLKFVFFFSSRKSSDRVCIASIFAPILLRDDIDAVLPVSLLGKKKFLLFFMEGP